MLHFYILKTKGFFIKYKINWCNTITEVINSSVAEGKNNIIFSLEKQIIFTTNNWRNWEGSWKKSICIFQSITPKLENMTFKDKEQSLKVIILRGIINIIKIIIEEGIIKLSESDRKALEDIMKEEEDNLKKEKEIINADNNDGQNNQNSQNNQNNNQNPSNNNNAPGKNSEKCILI